MLTHDIGNYLRCPICKQWGWTGTHKCAPAYGCRLEDWDKEEEVEVHANSPEEAATTFLEERFSDFEYPKSATVIVNDWRANHYAGHLYTYEVTVEAVPSFSAELIKDEPPKQEEEASEAQEF